MQYKRIKWKALGRFLNCSSVFLVWKDGECLFVGQSAKVGATVAREMRKKEPKAAREGIIIELIQVPSKKTASHLVRFLKLQHSPKYNTCPAGFYCPRLRHRIEKIGAAIEEERLLVAG